jgi:hypothetical protein
LLPIMITIRKALNQYLKKYSWLEVNES